VIGEKINEMILLNQQQEQHKNKLSKRQKIPKKGAPKHNSKPTEWKSEREIQ